MSAQVPIIAFLGATGGVINSVLVNALRSGAYVVALARTPLKLTQQLKAQNISDEVIASQLSIISGNALQVADIKKTLTAGRPGHLVNHIVTGLGGTPSLQFNWSAPFQLATLDNPTVCADAARALITALNDIYASNPSLQQQKPKLTYVSTTGVGNGPEDVPFGIQFLYHQILTIPHNDKREMERVFRENMRSDNAVFSGVIGIRPTLLTGGTNADEGVGHDKIRAGTEDQPAKGWTVCRADVGQWMWVNVISDKSKRMAWEGESVTLAN